MPKFFVNKEQIQDQTITLLGEDINHIKNVLRLSVEDEILINDRQGYDYQCIIKLIDSHQIIAHILEKVQANQEPQTKVVLFQSLIKGEKMDWVIQKSVEIGVHEIVPISVSRCVVKVDSGAKLHTKMQRWNKIAEAASKQSGRGRVPAVSEPMTFEKALAYASESLDCVCIPYEKENSVSMKTFLKKNPCKQIGIFIGPEGGFTEEEIRQASEKGICSVTLGKRILRSETAGLVAITSVMYETGEM